MSTAGDGRALSPVYAAIDLKSFYASAECVERGLDPLKALLVVADERRTDKTICLAVSPALKAYGLPGRCRLFEVCEKAREVEARTGRKPEIIVAPPRMRRYIEISARIYEKVYLAYAAPEDIHVYSIDEVFIDLTRYLAYYGKSARELVRCIIADILRETGITATAGIGTNLYLAKIAMDIVSKHVEADADGVRIAELDEISYREKLWAHRPLTSFWRIGRGTAARLARHGMVTMGDVARRSLANEDELFRLLGVDAELLIDHAWGIETCTMADIKAYRPSARSLSAGQVLPEPYPYEKARIIVREMADQMAMTLVAKGMMTDSVYLAVHYDRTGAEQGDWHGETETDWYGRTVPKSAHGRMQLTDAGGVRHATDSSREIIAAAAALFERLTDPNLPVRRLAVGLGNTVPREEALAQSRQMDFFTDAETLEREEQAREREHRIQQALLNIRGRYGGNAVLRGVSFVEGATGRERNRQIGGHDAGENSREEDGHGRL